MRTGDVAMLWDGFQRTRLRNIHLAGFHFELMRYCYVAGIRDLLKQCDRLARASHGEASSVSAYLSRVVLEVEGLDQKSMSRIRLFEEMGFRNEDGHASEL